MTTDYLSPLRYPGAKRKLAPHIKQLLQKYGCSGSVFVEPCCGGASLSLYLLNEKVVSSVILTDLDPWVASFWHMLFFETDQLISDIKDVEVTVETWKALKTRIPLTKREKAFYCFFFNRTCYSGILSGGMIGGHKQESKYKIDCRFNKKELIERIQLVAERFAHQILEVRTASVFDILDDAMVSEHHDRVYYIDPPYVSKGLSLYPHNFKLREHNRLWDGLKNFNKPWILSYHDHQIVREMYLQDEALERIHLDVMWVADRAKLGKELIISNLPSVRTRVQPILWPALDNVAEQTILNEIDDNVAAVQRE